MISKSLLSSLLMLGFCSQASLATNIEEIESAEKRPLQRTLNMSDLGDLQVMPFDFWQREINPHLPLNKTPLGDGRYDSILTVSKPFYYLVTGYWPDEEGVVGRPFPNVVIIPPESWKIRHSRGFYQEYIPEDIPPFLWRSLLNIAEDLSDTFWPYLLGTNVHTVSFLDYHIDDEGARAFAQSLQNTNVHTVDLSWNYIGDTGARAFAQFLQRTNVQKVNLSHNQIGDQGARDFAQSLQGTNVHTVDLSMNQIGAQGARDFAQSLQGTNVHTVVLSYNQIGAQGARDFGQFLQGTNVHTVELSMNQIGDQGARDFAQSLQRTNVHTVVLARNQIGDQGARDFGQFLQGTNVHTVELADNEIGNETQTFLQETYPHITWSF